MANEQRIRRNYMYGTITSGQNMNVGDATYTDASFAKIPAVPATAHFPITFEDAATGLYEIMYVIAHTANSTTVTLKRAQEGTSQLVWGPQNKWVHAPTVRDYHGIGNARQAQFKQGINYPTGSLVRVGARDQGIKAFAGDIVQLSFNVLVARGSFNFDFYTFNAGKKVTTCSTKMYSSSLYASFVAGLPGSSTQVQNVYASGFHDVTGTFPVSGSWQYQIQPADVSTAGTVTFGWVAQGNESGSDGLPFYTDSGDGYTQGTATHDSAHNKYYNWLQYGVYNVHNLGPQFYPG